jgi:hypothetical protein
MSSNNFKFKARYGLDRTVTKLDEETYTVEGPSLYSRMASFSQEEIDKDLSLANKISMYDFEGGPCFFVGGYFMQLPPSMWNDRVHMPIVRELRASSTEEGHSKVMIKVINEKHLPKPISS